MRRVEYHTDKVMHAQIETVVSEVVKLGSDNYKLIGWGRRIQIPLKAGHYRPASDTPFKWRFAGVPIMAQCWLGSFMIFRGILTNQYCLETP